MALVLSRNMHRRYLNESQRAAAVVACRAWLSNGQRPTSAPGAEVAQAAKEMATKADVGVRTIEQAKGAHAAGLGEAMHDGEVTTERTSEVAKLPAAERPAAVEVLPAARMASAKRSALPAKQTAAQVEALP